jgi:23S rRNA pseudouridine2605 synthase
MAAPRSPKPQGRPAPKRSGSASGRRQAGARADEKPQGPKRSNDRTPAKRKKKQSDQPFAVNEREQREGMRLQKFMASAGVSSRRKAEELIERGAVQVNGRVVKELGVRVFPGRDRVTVQGEPITAETKVYYVLNKPDEVVSSAAGSVDERGRPTVLSLMHGIPQRLYPVGRLDYHSRGVMLLTNDGVLAEALTHPRHGVVKTYHVKFQGKLTEEEEQLLRDGVELDDGAVTRPLVELFAFRETESNVWYQIGLTEGLNRQIRRMGDAINRPVLKLIRVAIGDITADGLAEGEFRALTTTEVAQLLDATAPKPGESKPAADKPRARTGGTKPPARKPAGESRSSGARTGAPKRAAPGGKPAGTRTRDGDGPRTRTRDGDGPRTRTRDGDGARTRTRDGDGPRTRTRDGDGSRTSTRSRDGEGARTSTRSRDGEGARTSTRSRSGEARPSERSRSEDRPRKPSRDAADRGSREGDRSAGDRRRAPAGKRPPAKPNKK